MKSEPLHEDVAASQKQRAELAEEPKTRESKIAELEQQISQSRVELASLKTQMDTAQSSNDNAVASNRMRIRELSELLAEQTASLNRERDLLSADRDIREPMAARNLHIADVFDTDAKGKTRPALGRIVFTEGKSLIFYAYHLNDNRVQDAGYGFGARRKGAVNRPKASASSIPTTRPRNAPFSGTTIRKS